MFFRLPLAPPRHLSAAIRKTSTLAKAKRARPSRVRGNGTSEHGSRFSRRGPRNSVKCETLARWLFLVAPRADFEPRWAGAGAGPQARARVGEVAAGAGASSSTFPGRGSRGRGRQFASIRALTSDADEYFFSSVSTSSPPSPAPAGPRLTAHCRGKQIRPTGLRQPEGCPVLDHSHARRRNEPLFPVRFGARPPPARSALPRMTARASARVRPQRPHAHSRGAVGRFQIGPSSSEHR